ncbi:MAG: nickel pincer cofactor biosynthesis protein LarC [Armatimonadetes bacterium]|nr:nickel pincer cofactor biosynthesis protein LarC [Armatimonadota bacterium]
MRIVYFDCFSGISGDMTLGALVDAGVSVDDLKGELRRLDLPNWDLTARKVVKQGISATDMMITVDDPVSHDHHHDGHDHHEGHTHSPSRSYSEIAALLNRSRLEEDVLQDSLAVFGKIAIAEAKIHGTTPDHIHFHELGGLDAIIDIVGSVIGLKLLGTDKVYCSPFPMSHGTIVCAHGTFPVPAPAVMELLKGATFRETDIEGELITPTGAGLLAHYATGFSAPPAFKTTAIGWGAGKKDYDFPNVLRLVVGETSGTGGDLELEQLTLLETNIDDMNPQLYDWVMEKAFDLGALDVSLTPIQMKKNRPAVQLSILTKPEHADSLRRLLFRETTTLGIRATQVDRFSLQRSEIIARTSFGELRVKVGFLGGKPVNFAPEYEDCRRIAAEHSLSFSEISEAATQEARRAFLDKDQVNR